MVNFTVIYVGNIKDKFFADAVAEYEKRIKGFCKLKNIEIKEKRPPDEPNEAQIKAILDAEGEKILSSIPQGAYKIALCVEGKKVTSEALSKMLTELPHKGFSEAVFIIGSSHGLADKVKSACDFRLSVSDMTFPHRLMRVILSEQLYRACTIEAQTGYHK